MSALFAARRLAAPAAAATAAAALYVNSTPGSPAAPAPFFAVAHMDAAAATVPRTKLPIYDPPEPEFEVVHVPANAVELAVRETRYALRDAFAGTKDSLQSLVSGWISVENRFTDAVQSVKSPDERLMPASLYVVVAAFTGSFLVRNRNILIRAIAPPAFLIAASTYFLPYTTTNAYNLVFNNLPPEAQQSIETAVQHTEMSVLMVRDRVTDLQQQARKMQQDFKTEARNAVPSALKSFLPGGAAGSDAAVPVAVRPSTEEVVAKVENMYSTRGKPGVKEVIEQDRRESNEA
ncbi:hypothetical protein AMAG_03522 [Allomyces macrogynus ATCC 38327]|uniref:MICOS complex subunit n=1 Tax=Allomyces macrogynus (strain ATCC 38327) TaxID=578462 RepID=A0A0L0S9Y5_ALLM3|nr:hypothetical protein AMAG_03522 [Allomyces macrogynus ATCC 38327]|eukprot:KNE59199.1 hypothetical protein AMAG_03522 [Allomyces macrogynus ATCC 38327]